MEEVGRESGRGDAHDGKVIEDGDEGEGEEEGKVTA